MNNEKANQEFQNIFEHTKSAVIAIDKLLNFAVSSRASDIHCDPCDSGIAIRFRVDGIMTIMGMLSRDMHDEFIARLKILSALRTDIHNVPQDGRWRALVADSTYNIRISIMPTYYGENAVLRILPSKVHGDLSFARLGFRPEHRDMITSVLGRKNGLILVTGPTGSGKTTTLHTCLSIKAREPLSIISLEDPVEYEIAGVRQVHIDHNYGVTFASGLRSALRQDPDVIMVGEIRDSETAKVAIHTALTGHLVLSTLHTNSALETIPRLVDMGIDHYLLASTLKLIISQRLIRIMCKICESSGCIECNNFGYVGRSVVAEVLSIDSKMVDLISQKSPFHILYEYAKATNFVTIDDDAMEKVNWGVTTENEVMSVLYT
jgi:type IV pilus assembly protein PilB